ncbi:MAG TPA: glycosyltransferase family 4 protein [Candidatus Limnocylindrales bacterium]|nr:glycosyltransferase family 4 protein [Candidatus Limnocylindrales bacterium]
MKLCIVSAKYPFGHAEPFLDTELRALAPAFERVVLFPATPRARRRGFLDVPAEVVALPLAGPSTLLLAARALLRRPRAAFGALAAILTERYPLRGKLKNLVVVPKGLALAEIARGRGIAHLHAYWLSTPATIAWLASRVAGIPFSATTHRWDLYENNLAARKLRDAAFVRTISERGRADLLRMTGADPAKVTVVRLGIALPPRGATAAGSANTGDVGPLRIVCAARLVPVKGHAYLIDALARLREMGIAFACTLAGEGELRGELERRVAAAGLADAVRFAGVVPHDELLARLERGEYDVAVISSIERSGGLMEGVPVALIEAMAAGAVVVATDSGSIGELVDGSTGVLVPQSDAAALAEGLARVARDPGLRARLRAGARARVERDFDGARTAERLRALIAGVRETPAAGYSVEEPDTCLEGA